METKFGKLKFNMHAIKIVHEKNTALKGKEVGNVIFTAILIYAGLSGYVYVSSFGVDEITTVPFEDIMDYTEELITQGKLEEIKAIHDAFMANRVLPTEADKKKEVKVKK